MRIKSELSSLNNMTKIKGMKLKGEFSVRCFISFIFLILFNEEKFRFNSHLISGLAQRNAKK